MTEKLQESLEKLKEAKKSLGEQREINFKQTSGMVKKMRGAMTEIRRAVDGKDEASFEEAFSDLLVFIGAICGGIFKSAKSAGFIDKARREIS